VDKSFLIPYRKKTINRNIDGLILFIAKQSFFHGKRRNLSLLIVASMIIVSSAYLYFLQTRDDEPPLIEDLEWKPKKVVNDKVYDGSIYFKARDEGSTIAEATVNFMPKIYPDLPKEAFPNETARTSNLMPMDGKFDEPIEEFSVDFGGIIGGREYEIQVNVEDLNGNGEISRIKTPYIRQYENLGQLLYDDGYVIGVSYFLYFPIPFKWEDAEPYAVHPLLGKYDGRDQLIHAKHIDWATGHGINCFYLGWGEGEEKNHNEYCKNYQLLLSSPLINQIKIAVQYETWRRLSYNQVPLVFSGNRDKFNLELGNWDGVVDDFEVLNRDFFSRENYLRIDGKPIVYFYDSDSLSGELDKFLITLSNLTDNGLFYFSDSAHPRVTTDEYLSDGQKIMIDKFDGWSNWASGWCWGWEHEEPRNITFPEAVADGYAFWCGLSLEYNRTFMPSVIPGFVHLKDDTWVSGGWNLQRDLGMFSMLLESALKYATSADGKKMIKIDTWSDYGEGTVIEPTIEEGFAYLEVMKDVLTAPSIFNMSWFPLDVRNDKVYSIKVAFEAEDLTIGSESPGISDAELEFIPVEYTHLPKEAFPEDNIREYELTPSDGSYGNVSENFAINITDITGGREYEVRVTVTDNDGNERVENFKTPYIREFENLGRQLYEKGVKVGILYGLITEDWVWDRYLELGGPYRPLLGYYATNSTRDIIIAERHMDWMSGHGINFIINLWSGLDDPGFRERDEFFKEAISKMDIFRTGGMKFGIVYESHWRFIGDPNLGINMSDPRNIQILKEDLSYLKINYFDHPSCLRIDGKPLFYIWGNGGMYGNITGGLEDVYKFMEENYGIQLYMVSDLGGPEVDENWGNSGGGTTATPMKDLAPLFDAMMTGVWLQPYSKQWGTYENYSETGFKYWYNFSLRNDLDHIPFVIPGASAKYTSWHPPEMREVDPSNVPRTIELWKKRIELAISYSNTFGFMVGDFNNLFENCHLEPTVQEGFAYLEAMKEVLTIQLSIKRFGFSYLNLTYNDDLLSILSNLENDGEIDGMDRAFVKWMGNYGDGWIRLKGLIYNVTKDGIVTQDEMGLIDTVSIIPLLIPEFNSFETSPERIYQGRDLSRWETALTDPEYQWAYPGEEPVSIEDVDAIHYGNYSEIISNPQLRCITAPTASHFGLVGEQNLYNFIHISGYKIRIPFIPRPIGEQTLNIEITGGGFQTFYGPNATGYEIGWGWTLNPWGEGLGRINVWEMTPKYPDTPVVDKVVPDTNWHSLIFILDKQKNHGYVLFDDRVYEINEILRSYHPEWRGESIDGGLVVEVGNTWPGDTCYHSIGMVQVKDWFWIWAPYS